MDINLNERLVWFDWVDPDGWVCRGRKYQNPVRGGDLLAHDVYHHLPGDRGSYRDEVRSLGAQFYLEQDDPNVRGQLQSAFFSVMAKTLDEGSRWLDGIKLKKPMGEKDWPKNFDAGMWRSMYVETLQELQLDFYVTDEKFHWDELFSDEQIDRHVSAIMEGILWAQSVYPDRHQALHNYQRLVREGGQGLTGQGFGVHITDGAWRVVRDEPYLTGRAHERLNTQQTQSDTKKNLPMTESSRGWR